MSNALIPNALLDFGGLPRFGDFSPSLITPAIDELLVQAREAVETAARASTPVSWEGFIAPLEDATERLSRAWGMVGHLNGVADTPELRGAYNENLPKITQFWTELGQNRALYEKYRALHDSPEYASLPAARRRAVELALQGFRLGGVELESPQRERFMELSERQAALGQKFSENVLDATCPPT
jgi:oligopeptidase A